MISKTNQPRSSSRVRAFHARQCGLRQPPVVGHVWLAFPVFSSGLTRTLVLFSNNQCAVVVVIRCGGFETRVWRGFGRWADSGLCGGRTFKIVLYVFSACTGGRSSGGRVGYLRQPPAPCDFGMEVPPESMFFPVGAVFQFRNGKVEPALDPECRHDTQCVLECTNRHSWSLFIAKLDNILVPKAIKYVLTIHSLSFCDIELARGCVTPKGVRTWINHYNLK